MEKFVDLDREGQAYWAGLWTDKQRRHQYYSLVYEDLLAPYRSQAGLELLEIGSAHGGSLCVWARWFDSAKIIGVDCHDNSGARQFIPELLEGAFDNIHNYLADAYSPLFYEKLGNFDIIIEDAAHTERHMTQTLEIYLPRVRAGGLLVIEDINPDLVNIERLRERCGDRKTEVRDLRALTGTMDSVCLIVYN